MAKLRAVGDIHRPEKSERSVTDIAKQTEKILKSKGYIILMNPEKIEYCPISTQFSQKSFALQMQN